MCILPLGYLFLVPISLKCQAKYELKCSKELLIKSNEILQKQVGVKELISNDSKEIKEYLASVGVKIPSPYCAAGQYYCFYQANKWYNYKYVIPIKRTAVATSWFTDAKLRGVNVWYQAKVNDLIVWKRNSTWQGHIERVTSIGRNGWVETVGFNTGGNNPREGDGVYRKRRHIYHPLNRLKILGIIGFKEV